MKIPVFALPLVALLPACAQAQTQSLPPAPKSKVTPPQGMQPAAKALLDRATASYKGASGLQLGVSSTLGGKEVGTTRILFSKPKRLSVARQSGGDTLRLLLNGDDFYVVQGTQYQKQKAPPVSISQLMQNVGGTTSQMIGSMIDGKNPIEAMQKEYAKAPFKGFKGRTVVLSSRLVDGEFYSGVQNTSTFSVKASDGSTHNYGNQVTAWFGGTPFALRRVQTRYSVDGKIINLNEKVFQQEFSPTFAEDAFKFNDTGLKLASDEEGDEQYWDPRLKVGTTPFKFQTKALDGTPISLDKYKGKVVLMDFWATWCGPCVASLPELKGAYDKYHSQGLEVIGISLDEDKNALTSFTKAKKMAWPQIFDGKGWQAAVPGVYGVKAIPFMLLIGKDGKIASVNPRGNIDAAVKAALAAS